MMKKMRKVLVDSSPPSSSLQLGDEARARFKHLALLQDYEQLLKETEAKKRKLHRTIQKKLNLQAEVKFLRRKYNSFLRNLPQKTSIQPKKLLNKMPTPTIRIAQPHNATKISDIPSQNRNQRAKKVESQRTPLLFDLNTVSLPNAEEMEGIQAEQEPMKVAHDLNVSIYKDVGNGSSHVGKRKISWQDQIALRA